MLSPASLRVPASVYKAWSGVRLHRRCGDHAPTAPGCGNPAAPRPRRSCRPGPRDTRRRPPRSPPRRGTRSTPPPAAPRAAPPVQGRCSGVVCCVAQARHKQRRCSVICKTQTACAHITQKFPAHCFPGGATCARQSFRRGSTTCTPNRGCSWDLQNADPPPCKSFRIPSPTASLAAPPVMALHAPFLSTLRFQTKTVGIVLNAVSLSNTTVRSPSPPAPRQLPLSIARPEHFNKMLSRIELRMRRSLAEPCKSLNRKPHRCGCAPATSRTEWVASTTLPRRVWVNTQRAFWVLGAHLASRLAACSSRPDIAP